MINNSVSKCGSPNETASQCKLSFFMLQRAILLVAHGIVSATQSAKCLVCNVATLAAGREDAMVISLQLADRPFINMQQSLSGIRVGMLKSAQLQHYHVVTHCCCQLSPGLYSDESYRWYCWLPFAAWHCKSWQGTA